MEALNNYNVNENKVIGFKSNLNNSQLIEDVLAFFEEHDMFSKHTAKSYNTHIKQFFEWKSNGSITDYRQLTERHLIVERRDVVKYRKELVDSGKYINRTINQKLDALKSFYKYLFSNDYDVNPNVFDLKALKEHEESKSYGSLTIEEVDLFANTAYEIEKELSNEKRILILLASRTSLRKSELLNLEWDMITEEDGVYVIRTIGKGKKPLVSAISKKMYDELLQLKLEGRDKIFEISNSSIQRMMDRIKNKLKIPKERNITFHSFRNVAPNWGIDNGDSLHQVAEQTNHSNINTLNEYYVAKNKDLSQRAGVRMDEELNLEFLNEMSREDLIDFVKSGGNSLHAKAHQFFQKECKK